MTYVPRQWRVTVQFNREGYKPYLSREAHLFPTFDAAFAYMVSLKPVEQNEERQLAKRVNMRNLDGSMEHAWTPMIWQTYDVWEWRVTLAAMILLVQKLQQLENRLSDVIGLSIGYDGFVSAEDLKSLIDDMALAAKGEFEHGQE